MQHITRTRGRAAIGRAFRCLLALCLLVSGLSGCKVGPARRHDIGTVGLTDIEGFLEFEARIRREDRTRSTGPVEQEFDYQTLYRESIGLETDGYIYHPNLIEFTIGGVFRLVQGEFESSFGGIERSSSESGTAQEYDVNLGFLQESKYPGSIYTRRSESLEPRSFSTSEIQTTTEHGLRFDYLGQTMPTSLLIESRVMEFDPIGESVERFKRKQNDVLQFETAYVFNDRSELSLEYEHEEVIEDPFDIAFQIDDLRLRHEWEFGENEQNRLDSDLNYYAQVGSIELERLQWRERLSLRYTDTLRSWYNLDVTQRTQGGSSGQASDELSYYLEGTHEHRLYDSLITELMTFINSEQFDSGAAIDRLGGTLSFNYRKTNPWGVLSADYTFDYETTERTGWNQVIQIIDRPGTLRDPTPITLADQNIAIDSIVITDVTGLTIYRSIRDYTIFTFAGRIEIHRVPTGLIADGQAVLIDFEIHSIGDFELDSLAQRFGIRQNFHFGLAPYYRVIWQDNTVTGEDTSITVEEDILAHIFGVEFVRDSFRAMAEYEDHWSSVSPYQTVQVGASYTHKFDFGGVARGNVRWTNTVWDPPNARERTYLIFIGGYQQPITRHLFFEGELQYIQEDDTISGVQDGIDLDLSLEWLIRQTEFRLTYELGRFENDFTFNESSMLYVQLKRNF